MKTGWKIFIAILLFILVDAAAGYVLSTKAWTKLGGKNTPPPTVAKISPSHEKISPTKTYSNPDMHISFNYPQDLQLTEVRPHLLTIKNPSSTSLDSSLFIFETTIPNNAKTIDIPFILKGKIKTQIAIPVHNLTAKQITYTDGIILITLRKNQQFIMVRIPKDSKAVGDAITDFVDTVKTMK